MVGDSLQCCKAGGFHTDYVKGRVQDYVVNSEDDEWWPRIQDDLQVDDGERDRSWYFDLDLLRY